MMKLVNGEPVQCTPEEEASILAEWAANDASSNLTAAKKAKITDLRNEGFARIQALFPAIASIDELNLVQEMWLSIAVSARQPTTKFQKAITIFQVERQAESTINAMTDVATVSAYNVVTAPLWP